MVSDAMERIAKGFGMELYAYDAFCPKDVIEKDGVKAVDSAEELYKTCNIVSLHIPATAETKTPSIMICWPICRKGLSWLIRPAKK